MKDGRCGTIITSSLSFRVELHHTGVFFSCFGYNNLFPRFMQCPKGQVFSYCDMSRKLKVLEKPRDVKLHRVHFHAPPSTLYTGEKISLTCSAYRPKHKTLTWKLHSSRLSLHQLNITKTDFMNGSRTVSSISFEIQKVQDGMVLYCLDISPNETSKICTANKKLWTYCDFTPAIRVIDDGPRGPPEFILEYEGFPDPLAPNTMASASCAVTHGGSGTLIWVAYFNSGPKAFFFNETERNPVVSFSGVWILNAFWLFLPLIVLMLIALICIPLALFRSPSNMSEAYHEDDDYTTGISDNKTYLETSPALQLLTQQSFIDAFLGPNADVDGAMEAKKMGRKLKPGTSSSVDDFHALSDGSMFYEVMKPKGHVINLQDRLARQQKQLAKRKKAVSGTVTSIGQSGTTGSQRSTFQS
ncbi:hypothetical protein EGW08_022494 [Elysia chlorotica]|uniref:Ig-like domain-containing protein n=1 Tax=Elysia chlorotica TaxID=188477 RepID=A0A3S1AR49_ELYCH|nr:hypothetical protein EGW08_022494 [Elysia chlorotica]